ncbi:uncharacterized protein LOC130992040 [Salvia miltiorrhiza]|uniref:uncharacterized protein LOC130992040 n=1 Tax=Salvia miltiorrhiza TaxID=226208 RepID=UPI0025ABCE01|nr:uncharacterized protein LOC130992040 [Salvia miltiorrhiza]
MTRPRASSCSSPSSCGGRIGSPGCLSRILRRILCFSNLPLCSFDHFQADESPGPTSAPGSTPGVVARLMGLDSIPRAEALEQSSADQFKTSRLRRLRDIPPYRELQDDNFFILSFEKRRESRRDREKRRRDRDRERECLQGKNKENENPENLLLLLNNPCEKTEKSKKIMGKKYAITFENEADSENSSPNSVLEFVGFSADQESVCSGEVSRLANSKTRRPLSEELESCGDSVSNKRVEQEGEEVVTSRPNHAAAAKLGGIGKLAAVETVRSTWLHNEILQNKQCLLEIGRDVASNIFDHLLEELVINIQQF